MIDLQAMPLLQLSSIAELCQLVRSTAAGGWAVYPRGGGTMLDYGLPPTKPGVGVDLRKLDQVIDYPARDMTITVQAGITIAKLQSILAAEKQRLPIDVPLPEQATLGGAIACNVSGPRRYGFGTFRDYVIGISVVNDRGEEIKAGGRVVKNVAGYDLCKLYTGSLGTLGIITQVTLKVRPVPEVSRLLELPCPTATLSPLLDHLHGSRTRPVCLSALRNAKAHSASWFVLVGFEDNQEAITWQIQELERQVERLGIASHPLRTSWTALAAFPLVPPAPIVFQANLLPQTVASFGQLAEPHAPHLLAHAGNGIVIGHLSEDATLEQARDTIVRLRAAAVEAQGNLTLLRCPNEWKAALGVWGRPRGDWLLMRKIKQQLDPGNLFNPGRFVDKL